MPEARSALRVGKPIDSSQLVLELNSWILESGRPTGGKKKKSFVLPLGRWHKKYKYVLLVASLPPVSSNFLDVIQLYILILSILWHRRVLMRDQLRIRMSSITIETQYFSWFLGNIKSFHFSYRMLKATVRFRSQRRTLPERSEPQEKNILPLSTQGCDEGEVVSRGSLTSNFQRQQWSQTTWSLIYSQKSALPMFSVPQCTFLTFLLDLPLLSVLMMERRLFISTHSSKSVLFLLTICFLLLS